MSRDRLPIVVGLGEALWDVFPDGRRPGGAPANVAFHAGQLGFEGVVASAIGRDQDGDDYAAELLSHGLTDRFLQRDHHPTGRVTITLDDGEPDYVIHEDVAWDHLRWTVRWASLASQTAAVCFGTLAQRSPSSRETIELFLGATSSDCLIVYDVNLRKQFYSRAIIEHSLRRATLVKLNAAEVWVLNRLLRIEASRIETFGELLRRRYRLGHVCVTQGANGATLIGPEGVIVAEAEPIRLVDAVGAGDAFTAGLIAGLLRGHPGAESLRLAIRMGGLVAARRGAMPVIDRSRINPFESVTESKDGR